MTSRSKGEDRQRAGPNSVGRPRPRSHNFSISTSAQLAVSGRSFMTTPAVHSPLVKEARPSPEVEQDLAQLQPDVALDPPTPPIESANLLPRLANDDSTVGSVASRPPRVTRQDSSPNFRRRSSMHASSEDEALSWDDFLGQYASGRLDLSKSPALPRPSSNTIGIPRLVRAKSISVPVAQDELSDSTSIPMSASSSSSSFSSPSRPAIVHKNASDSLPNSFVKPETITRPQSAGRTRSSPATTSPTISQRRGGTRMLLSDMAPPPVPDPRRHSGKLSPPMAISPSARPITPAAVADAATVRWAGAHINIAPLSLSSPERMSPPPRYFLERYPWLWKIAYRLAHAFTFFLSFFLPGELLDPLSDYVSGLPTPQQKAMKEYLGARNSSASLVDEEFFPNGTTLTVGTDAPTHTAAEQKSTKLRLKEPAVPSKILHSTTGPNEPNGQSALDEGGAADFCEVPALGSSMSHENGNVQPFILSPLLPPFAMPTSSPSPPSTADSAEPSSPSTSSATTPTNAPTTLLLAAATEVHDHAHQSRLAADLVGAASLPVAAPEVPYLPSDEAQYQARGYFVPPNPVNEVERRTALYR